MCQARAVASGQRAPSTDGPSSHRRERAVDRCLVLSGRLGKGHDTLADACVESLRPRHVETRTLDALALMGRAQGAAGDWVFRRLLAAAPLYDGFHFDQLEGGKGLARLADRLSLRHALPALEAAVRDFPPELIISVFATGAAAASRYKTEHPDVATVVFITDVAAHHLWVQDNTDLFLVISSVSAATVRRYRPSALVEVVTAPVRDSFYDPPERTDARRCLGVPDDAPCVVLMSGGWGIGPLAETARRLSESGVWVLAVAGMNHSLEKRLRGLASETRLVVPFGYTDAVADLMAAADVVITSSGDTCREARAVGRRLVLIDVVPGHGRENVLHELELGAASVASPTAESISGVTAAVLRRDEPDPPSVGSRDEWDRQFRRALDGIGMRLPA
jgi:UDP-N-acetylglucosamine:LPS N-acetylglucosamine transferase